MTTDLDDSFTIEDSAPAVSNQMPPVEPSMARAPPSNEVHTRNGRIVRPPARFRDDYIVTDVVHTHRLSISLLI